MTIIGKYFKHSACIWLRFPKNDMSIRWAHFEHSMSNLCEFCQKMGEDCLIIDMSTLWVTINSIKRIIEIYGDDFKTNLDSYLSTQSI